MFLTLPQLTLMVKALRAPNAPALWHACWVRYASLWAICPDCSHRTPVTFVTLKEWFYFHKVLDNIVLDAPPKEAVHHPC